MQPTTTVSTQEIPEFDLVQPLRPAKRSRKCIDPLTTCLLLLVWILLCLICITLLGSASFATSSDSDAGQFATPDEIGFTTGLVTLPVLFCLICNEALLDRSWRRIHYFAMEGKKEPMSLTQLAKNVRAANFNIGDFVFRFWKASSEEWTSATSYAVLRFGTTISIASAQFCVSWVPSSDGYEVHKRYIWLLVPVCLHAMSVFGPLLLWRRWPCVYFSDKFCDVGLWKKYRHINDLVKGSLASYEDIAATLEVGSVISPGRPRAIRIRVQTGRQVTAKLKGLWFGLLGMFIPPLLAWKLDLSHHVLTLGEYRFVFTLVFTLQNVFYLQALEFAIWNISLDGFCKVPGARPNRTMRYLGYSSGMVLFAKGCKQRRPLRAAILLWFFWFQACLMRFLLVLYTFCVNVLSYYSLADMSDILDPTFWIGWLAITLGVSFPLFIIWIFMKSDAPVGPVDGWRWAQIANGAVHTDGFWGIYNGRACWSMEARSFAEFEGEEMV